MKLSTKIILPIILISALLILLAGCMGTVPDESPGYAPGTTTITGIIAAPCCSTSSTAVSEDITPSDWCLQCEKDWFLQKNIEVILTYEGEEVGSTTTNTKGEYTFTDLSAGENYVITAICPDDGGKPLVKDVVKEVVDGEDYDAGITDCESTALGLIVDALVNLGISSEYIILEDIQSSVQFKSFVEAVCEVLENCGDVTSDENLLDQGNLVLMEILGDNPGWTGGEVICVWNIPDDPCAGVPDPTVSAGPDQSDEVCPGATKDVDFTGSGSGKGTISYSWNFDNGGSTNDSTVQNPQDVPFGVGVYNVVLTVTDDCGSATDTMIVTITESAGVTAYAGEDQEEEVCPGANALIDLAGSGSGTGALSYAWDLDDDGFFDDSTVQNPQDVPFGVGVYNVVLTVTDDCGSATDTMIVTITESAGVTAYAGEDQEEEVCPGANALIDLAGSGSGTGALSYAWDLDDDGFFDDSTAQNPQDVPFGAAGSPHTVTLQVTDQCSSTTDEMIVTITESAGVTAYAGEDQEEEVCPGANALIDLAGSGSGTGALSYAWDLDDDGFFDDSTAQNPQDVPFGAAGSPHTVTLQVTDQCSSTTDEMIVTITESAGVTAYAGEDQEEEVCPGANALIDLAGSGSGTGALSYAWDLDDDGFFDDSTAQNPQDVPFGAAGSPHTVTLQVTDQCSSTTDEMIVTITESAGVTAYAGEDQEEEVCPGANALIDLAGSGSGTGALSYAWDLDDDGFFDDSTAQNPQDVPFGAAGSPHTVTLQVTDQCSSTTDEMIVTITESAGVTAYAGEDQEEEVCPGANALIDLAGSGSGTGALSYAWDLDDDGFFDDSTAQNPQDVPFGAAGSPHTVTLQVTDQCSSTTDEMIVTITESAGVTAYAGEDQEEEVCPGANALIDLAGSGSGTGALSYAWDLDDDGFFDDSTAQNPQDVPFGAAGSPHTVTLQVTDQCSSTTDEMIVTITESAGVTAYAGEDQEEEVCPGANALIDLAGSGSGTGALSYAWDLDDDGFFDDSTAQNPQDVPFGAAGSPHTVTLQVTDQCSSTTDEMIVTITESAALTGATFEGGPIVLCVDYDRDIGSEITITPELNSVPGTPMTLDYCVNSCADCTCFITITDSGGGAFSLVGPTTLRGISEGMGYITITYTRITSCGEESVESAPIEVIVEADRFFLIDNKSPDPHTLDINDPNPLITVPHNANHALFGVSACNDPDAVIEFQYDRSHCEQGSGLSPWILVPAGTIDPTQINLCQNDHTYLSIRINGVVANTFDIYRPPQ